MTVSAHVLDGVRGGPVAGVGVRLDRLRGDGTWHRITEGTTDRNGRFGCFESGGLSTGTYRWVFAAGDFFARQNVSSFHPEVPVVFAVEDSSQKYHVPLLLSPFSYTTYRGY
ncbi:hydroxyisourate hydrolase [Streptomyces mirabilis]|uniref:hydroxyisourate hydrolase n=1 Tax=Streptomyces mirabilis TaxID=68239 RepID=UPI003676B06E